MAKTKTQQSGPAKSDVVRLFKQYAPNQWRRSDEFEDDRRVQTLRRKEEQLRMTIESVRKRMKLDRLEAQADKYAEKANQLQTELSDARRKQYSDLKAKLILDGPTPEVIAAIKRFIGLDD